MKKELASYLEYGMERIVELCGIPSPTGYTRTIEERVSAILAESGFEPEYSVKRSVRCCLGGSGSPLVLAAHLDTLGAMVRSIKPNGRLRIAKIGGYPENYIENENCVVHSRCGKEYTGRFLLDKPAVHVNKDVGGAKRDDSTIELVLDENVRKIDEVRALGISAGDFVSFDPRTIVTPSGYIKSRHLDDKASSALLLALAKYVREQEPVLGREVWLLFTNYEEVGHGGAAGLPEHTAEMLSVDMGAIGDDLGTDEHCVSICAKDSKGPYDHRITGRLADLAESQKLRYAVDIYPFYGSDTGAALSAGWDIRHGLVGPGIQASHGYERAHRDGLANTLALLAAYIELGAEGV
jgi:putative aminopeptidase FrvX